MLAGYTRMLVTDLAYGNTPRRFRTMLAALSQGDGLGIAGDLFGEVNRLGAEGLVF